MADDPTPAAPIAPPTPPAEPSARIAAAVRQWRDEAIANGPIARDTACWNHLDAALRALVAAICKEI